MGNHEGIESPIVQLGEEILGRRGRLATVVGEISNRHIGRTAFQIRQLGLIGYEVETAALAIIETITAHQEGRGHQGSNVLDSERCARSDRPGRNLVVFESANDDVLVSVVVVGLKY